MMSFAIPSTLEGHPSPRLSCTRLKSDALCLFVLYGCIESIIATNMRGVDDCSGGSKGAYSEVSRSTSHSKRVRTSWVWTYVEIPTCVDAFYTCTRWFPISIMYPQAYVSATVVDTRCNELFYIVKECCNGVCYMLGEFRRVPLALCVRNGHTRMRCLQLSSYGFLYYDNRLNPIDNQTCDNRLHELFT